MLLRALAIWLVIAAAEVAQGWLRVRLLNRRVGDRRARQIGVGTGSLLILLIAWLALPWIGPRTPSEAWLVGAVWAGLMVALDVGFGRWVFRASWARIAEEFDLSRGRSLVLGLLVVLAAPRIVALGRGLF